jgi:hypothetical protein
MGRLTYARLIGDPSAAAHILEENHLVEARSFFIYQ